MIALSLLVIAGIYVVIGGLIIKRISRRWLKGLMVVIWILIPTGDEIVGRVYFNHLCSTEGGVKVYQSVELPAEYWDDKGVGKFFKVNGDLDHSFFRGRFEELSFTNPYSSALGIDETRQKVVDKSNQVVLGEVVSFMFWGGWFSRNFPAQDTAVDCKAFHGNRFWHEFYMGLFKPVKPETTQGR
ncbi:MAG: hypothetical protein WB870_11770 [Gallionellaceae bacterium]